MTEIVQAKSGDKTVKKDGVFLLSHYHPKRDAEKIVNDNFGDKNGFYVIFGSGLGAIPESLMNRGVSREDILVFEPDPLLEKFLKDNYPDLRRTESGVPIADILEAKLMENKRPVFLSMESFRKAYPMEYKSFYSHYAEQFKFAVENMKVSVFFSKVWFVNFFRNIHTAQSKKNYFYPDAPAKVSDWPFLVVAAGPSLNGKLEDIRKVQDGCIIISVLSAARTLVKNGIVPDLIIASDAGVGNKMHAHGIPDNIPYLANVYASSCLLAGLKNPVIFYNLKEEIAQLSFMLKYPSVTIDAGLLARELTTGPVIFCGFDLGYDIFSGSHSSGNAFVEMRGSAFHRLNPVYGTLSSFLKRKDIHPMGISAGSRWFTHKQFMMVKDSAERIFRGEVYTGEGVELTGLNRVPLLQGNIPAKGKRDKEKEIEKLRGIFAKYENILPHLEKILDRYKRDFAAANSVMSRKILLRENITGMDVHKAKDYIFRKIETIAGNDAAMPRIR